MGKKKSIFLMVLLTIVIVVLSAITVVPSFTIPGTVKKWNPVVNQYDLGSELGGAYYTYYYPEGIISAIEYKNEYDAIEDEEERKEYADSYKQYKGLYLSKDADYAIFNEDGTEISDEFDKAFNAAKDEIVARYAKKGYSDYSVTVVDDYALRVQVPASEKTDGNTAFQNAFYTLGFFAETGELEIMLGDTIVEQRVDYEVDELIKGFDVKTKNGVAYIEVTFTSVGKEMIKNYRENAGEDTLKIMLGDNAVMEISATEHVTTRNVVRYYLAYDSEITYVETMTILLNSALENGGFDITFKTVSSTDVRTVETFTGNNTRTLTYIAIAVVMVAMIAFAIVKMGGFGVSNAYASVSYFVVVAICYAFVSSGVFEITLGSVLVFLLGLALVNVLNAKVFEAIRAELALGKTVESSVKAGYKNTIWNVVDVYAVTLLGAVALLIGVAGVYGLALQALICVATAAFCNLLWTRVINVMLLSASKDKYGYFRFARNEEDDDDD